MSVVVCKVNEDNIEVAADSICVSGWSKLPISGNRHIKLAKYNGMIVGGVGLAEEVSLFFHYMKTHTIDEVTERVSLISFLNLEIGSLPIPALQLLKQIILLLTRVRRSLLAGC
jgi:hypothetical protein